MKEESRRLQGHVKLIHLKRAKYHLNRERENNQILYNHWYVLEQKVQIHSILKIVKCHGYETNAF